PDNLTLRLNGTVLELLDNGTVVLSRPLANTTSIVLTGAVNEPDSLTIDNGFGGLIQVPGGIAFDGGAGGGNTLFLLSTPAADTLQLWPGGAVFNGAETIFVSNVLAVTGFGAANDSAYLSDSPGTDAFTGTPTYSFLTGPGFYNLAQGFGTIVASAS